MGGQTTVRKKVYTSIEIIKRPQRRHFERSSRSSESTGQTFTIHQLMFPTSRLVMKPVHVEPTAHEGKHTHALQNCIHITKGPSDCVRKREERKVTKPGSQQPWERLRRSRRSARIRFCGIVWEDQKKRELAITNRANPFAGSLLRTHAGTICVGSLIASGYQRTDTLEPIPRRFCLNA